MLSVVGEIERHLLGKAHLALRKLLGEMMKFPENEKVGRLCLLNLH